MTPTADPDRLLQQTAWLRTLAGHLLRDPHAVDDVVQEACVAALLQPSLPGANEAGLRAWLASVLRRVIAMGHRRAARRCRREIAAARTEVQPSVADGVERAATQRALLDAVLRLEAADRDVVVLRYFEGMPPRAIAARLGTTSAAVRSRLTRALAKLRASLETEHGGDRRSLALALAPLAAGNASKAGWIGMAIGKKALVAAAAALVMCCIGASWLTEPPAEPAAAPATAPPGSATLGAPIAATAAGSAGASNQRREVVDGKPGSATAPQSKKKLIALVRCVDAAQRPIAGALVSAADVVGQPSAVSGEDGRARLELDWPAKLTYGNDSWIFLEATATGMCRLRRQESATTAAPIQFGDMVLTPGGDLHGRVIDAGDAPVADVHVAVVAAAAAAGGAVEEERRVLGRGFRGLGRDLKFTATTDASGAYRFAGLPEGAVSVLARRHGHYCAYSPPVVVLAARDVAAADLRLQPLRAEHVIAGIVVDERGNPMPGASVSAFVNRGARNVDAIARTRARSPDATFQLAVPGGCKYSLQVEAQRDPSRFVLWHDVAAGSEGLRVAFPAERAVVVIVQDAYGSRIHAPQLMLADADGFGLHDRVTRADELLQLTLPTVPFCLHVSAAGYLHRALGPFEPTAVSDPIRVTLQRAAMLRGRVTAAGKPMPGATLHLHRAPEQGGLRFAGGLRTRISEAILPASTDADGCFAMPIVLAGRFVLHAQAPGLARAESAMLELHPEQAREGIELQLVPPAVLKGRVVGALGVDVQGTIVGATCGDGHVHTCIADAEGRYELTGLAPGSWQVRRCEAADQQWLREARTWPSPDAEAVIADVELRSGETTVFDLDLRASAPAQLRGLVLLGGRAASGWNVAVWREGSFVGTRTGPDGTFTLTVPISGAASILLSTSDAGAGQLSVSQPLTLSVGDNEWRCELPVGSLALSDLPASERARDSDSPVRYALVWPDLGAGRRASFTFEPDAAAGFLGSVPAGRVEVRRRGTSHNREPASWPLLATVAVKLGEETSASLKR
jgi:RNA polymerase sigma-70 factor (ECF subfamily)